MEVKKIDKKLYSILEPYDNWFNDEGKEKNQEVKKALANFYKELLKRKPGKGNIARIPDEVYVQILANIKQAFKEQKYMRAANEIITLMHYEPGNKIGNKIWEDLKKLLEEELSQ